MTRQPKPESITLVLTPPKADDAGQTWRRLRALLKAAWRAYGLKCVKVTAGGSTVTADEIREEQP